MFRNFKFPFFRESLYSRITVMNNCKSEFTFCWAFLYLPHIICLGVYGKVEAKRDILRIYLGRDQRLGHLITNLTTNRPVNFRSGLLRFVTHHMKILKEQLYYHHGTNLEKKAAHHSQDLRFRSVWSLGSGRMKPDMPGSPRRPLPCKEKEKAVQPWRLPSVHGNKYYQSGRE